MISTPIFPPEIISTSVYVMTIALWSVGTIYVVNTYIKQNISWHIYAFVLVSKHRLPVLPHESTVPTIEQKQRHLSRQQS